MFFLKLEKLKGKSYSDELIDKLDSWLYHLPTRMHDCIECEFFASEFKVDLDKVISLFADAVNMQVLKINYHIYCELCDDIVFSTDKIEEIDRDEVFTCDEGHRVTVNKDNICFTFELIAEPTGNGVKKKLILK